MTGLSKAIFHRGAAELWVLGERVRTARTRDLATLWSAALMALLAGAILSGSALRIIDTRLGDVWDRGVFSTGPTRIYSFIQGRPLEVCTTYLEDRTAAGQRLRADPERWSSLFGMVRSHYAASRSVLSQPCRGEWRWQPGSFDHLYAGIGRDFPYAWVFVRAGLTDVAVLCGILGLSILGLAIVPYLAWRASGSIAASLISTAASGWIAFLIGLRHLGDVEALMLAGISFLATALVLGVHSSAGRTLRPGSLLWNAALIGSLALVSLSYLFIAPAASSLFVYLAPGLAVASALLARDWRALARGAVALAVVASVMASYLGFTSATLAPLTTVNFGAGGTFAPLALTTGFWTERPNSLGVPLGDYGVFLGAEIDPILLKFKKEIMDYQTYGYYGGYVAKLALSHPLEAAQHIIARFFWKLAFLNKLMFEWIHVKDWGIVLSPLVIVALICFVAAVVRLHVARTIVLAFPLFNFFALDMLTHVVHVHTRYYASGLVGLVILTPVVAILGSRAGVFLVSGYRNLARRRHLELARWLRSKRILGIPNVGIVALAFILLILPISRGVQRQLAVFGIMFYPWLGVYETKLRNGQPVPRWLPDLPDQVSRKLDGLRELGYAPAAVSTYGAWTHRKYADWVWILDAQGNPAPHLIGFTANQVQELRRESLERSMALFERALEEDPDNPLLPAQAMLVYGAEYPRALPIFKKALDRWPDHPFGGWMALNVVAQTGGKEREQYAQAYERHASRFLHAAAQNRPGFRAIPSLQTKGLTVRNRKSGLLVTIPPGTEAIFGPAEMHASTRGMLIFFAQLASGEATARLRLTSDKGPRDTEPSSFQDLDLIRYSKIEWTGGDPVRRMNLVVQAGPAGATIFISDFYPLVLAPSVPR